MKTRTALEGVGAALLVTPYMPYIDPSHLLLYNLGFPVTNLIGGLLVDMLGVAILATGFLVAVQYFPAALQRILNSLFAGILLWRIVDLALLQLMQPGSWITFYWLSVRLLIFIVILPLLGLLSYFLPRITEPVVRAVRLVIAAFAFSALWIIPELLHIALVPKPNKSSAFVHLPAPAPGDSSRRIVWILFDELSYDQTFDHRFPGIKLPNFDHLRSGSFSFSNLKPDGYFTEFIIPSLFIGRHIDQFRSTFDGDLWYKDKSQDRWLAYDSNATLFGLAQRNGWSTGVDGWAIPYCHILASVLNVCSWEPVPSQPMGEFGTSEAKSVLANAVILPNAILTKLTNRTATVSNANHIQEYRNTMERTHALIENGQIRFVFLHLNVPHPPGIYDRQRHTLHPGGNYLDNLVLADDTLGALLQEIDASPSANQTTVIVSSDHSWRIPIWRYLSWSAEEERASGGHFDDRLVLLIHFPGQSSGNDVNSALPELLEHDIIADMLRGQINNPGDLEAFLSQHGR
jgi:hypothetical protein